MQAKLLALITKPANVIILGLLLVIGYMSFQGYLLTNKVEELTQVIQEKDKELGQKEAEILYLNASVESVSKLNKEKDEKFEKLQLLYNDIRIKYSDTSEKLAEIEKAKADRLAKYKDYNKRMTTKMLNSKPKMVERRIKAATEIALNEFNLLTK